MKKIRVAILKNESPEEFKDWTKACDNFLDKIDYDIIDLTTSDWYENISQHNYDFLLAKPSGTTSLFKQLYDERIHILNSVLKLRIYPTPIEIYIHENKRFLYSWLKANRLPHPETKIFYFKEEANQFIVYSHFPIVAKVNIGASGSGVKILRNKAEALRYIELAFSSNGAPRRWGPNLIKGGLFLRGLHYIIHPTDIMKKMKMYSSKKSDKQSGFLLFQEYIPHNYEWRIVVIGGSYFAHKKLKIGEKASGSLLKQYDNPPLKLFDFAKEIMEKHGLYSQAIDVFELDDGRLLINEMQCIFGQSDSYQMLIDGKPGRYIFQNGKWIFEKGNFNHNQSYDLRIEHVLTLMSIR